jgi:hypothetical protein
MPPSAEPTGETNAPPCAEPADEPTAQPHATAVATSEELRRAALARSARRNAEVARKRLAWRQAARVARLLTTWLVPLLVLGSLGWSSRPQPDESTPPRPGAQAQSLSDPARPH